MMKVIKGVYEKGHLLLPDDYEYPEKVEVVIIFPDLQEKLPSINPAQLKELIGLMSAGGNAVEDTERLYE